MKKYEIWVGSYHLGQGYDPPNKPEKLAEVEATSFKIACFLYELDSLAENLRFRMKRGDSYIEDTHFGTIYYNAKINGNYWTGKYYESEEEALKSFKYSNFGD